MAVPEAFTSLSSCCNSTMPILNNFRGTETNENSDKRLDIISVTLRSLGSNRNFNCFPTHCRELLASEVENEDDIPGSNDDLGSASTSSSYKRQRNGHDAGQSNYSVLASSVSPVEHPTEDNPPTEPNIDETEKAQVSFFSLVCISFVFC